MCATVDRASAVCLVTPVTARTVTTVPEKQSISTYQGRPGLQVRSEAASQRPGVSDGRRADRQVQVPPGFEELELRLGRDALAKRALGAEHDEVVVQPLLDPPQRRGVIRCRRRGDIEAHRLDLSEERRVALPGAGRIVQQYEHALALPR